MAGSVKIRFPPVSLRHTIAAVQALALVLLATVGVANSIERFAPVPEPLGLADPCRARGPAGRWVKMSTQGAPASIHNAGWLDSATVWDGARILVALRKNGVWSGTAFDPCANAWAPFPETHELAHVEPWPPDGHDRPFQPSHANGSVDSFEKISVWDTARKAWVVVESRQPLAPREHYAVVFAGRRLLVWGGWVYPTGTRGDGAVLDVAHKTWEKMSPAGAPSPRLEPTVAWTGSRLVVWSGRTATAPGVLRVLEDGATYDLAADRWTPISTAGAPSPRTEATAVWTGRKLVVVGGLPAVGTLPPGGGPPLRDGAVYDPASDRWTPLAPPPGDVLLPKKNVGPLTRILVAADGRVIFLPERLDKVVILDAERARWSTIDAGDLGRPRSQYRAFLVGRRLVIWGGLTVLAEHLCGPPIPGQPLCDPWGESAPRDDGWMILLPPLESPPARP
jgi:hypothetical protein